MAVFTVKYRTAMLRPDVLLSLTSCIKNIFDTHGKGSRMIRIGGIENHLHILFTLSPNIALADLIREIKSRSSRWLNERDFYTSHFEWQRGYAAFSYSSSSKERVINYIDNQAVHHQRVTFLVELKNLLEKYELASDPRDMPALPI